MPAPEDRSHSHGLEVAPRSHPGALLTPQQQRGQGERCWEAQENRVQRLLAAGQSPRSARGRRRAAAGPLLPLPFLPPAAPGWLRQP